MKNRLEGLFRKNSPPVSLRELEDEMDADDNVETDEDCCENERVSLLDFLSLLGLMSFVVAGMVVLGIFTGMW